MSLKKIIQFLVVGVFVFFSFLIPILNTQAQTEKQVMNKSEALGMLETLKKYDCYSKMDINHMADQLSAPVNSTTDSQGNPTYNYDAIHEVSNTIVQQCLYEDIMAQAEGKSTQESTDRLKSVHSLFVGLQSRGVYEKNTDFFSAIKGSFHGRDMFKILAQILPSGLFIAPDPFGIITLKDLDTKSLNTEKIQHILATSVKILDQKQWNGFRFASFPLPTLSTFLLPLPIIFAIFIAALAYTIYTQVMLANNQPLAKLTSIFSDSAIRWLIWWLSPAMLFFTLIVSNLGGLAVLRLASGDSTKCQHEVLVCTVTMTNINAALTYWPNVDTDYIQNDSDFWVQVRKAVGGIVPIMNILNIANPAKKIDLSEDANKFLTNKEQNPIIYYSFVLVAIISVFLLSNLAISLALTSLELVLFFLLLRISIFIPSVDKTLFTRKCKSILSQHTISYLTAAVMVKITSIVSTNINLGGLIFLIVLYTFGIGIINKALVEHFGFIHHFKMRENSPIIQGITNLKTDIKKIFAKAKNQAKTTYDLIPSIIRKKVGSQAALTVKKINFKK